MTFPELNFSGIAGLIFLVTFVLAMAIFAFLGRRGAAPAFRPISAFQNLRRAIGMAVESGKRLHLTLGRGSLIGTEGTSAVVGLNILERVTRTASISDRPPIATSGDGSLGILSQDVLYNAFQAMGVSTTFDPDFGQVTGLTPFAYAAGAMPTAFDENVSTTILSGHFGSEVALITDASERSGAITLAGSDDLTAQAVMYTSAQEPLIGEELYAAGAYLATGGMQTASLRAQDLLRWSLIFGILIGAALKFIGVI